jgi:FMN phosphatase YigB (HAD superfamily)
MVDTIFIASDFLMTKEKEQASNRRWLLDFLRRPIEQATHVEPQSFGSSLTRPDAFSRAHFFALSGIEVDVAATQFWFDDALISDDSLTYLASHLRPNCVIIGYELSEQTRRLLSRVDVPWVDMWLHPIRFLDDVLFGFAASSEAVYNAISTFHISEDVFYLYADRIRIQYYKGVRRPDLPIKPGSALFIGQTLEDKAICDGGRMLNLLDFRGAFERLGSQYGTVYYSRHPFVKSGDEAILKLVQSCGFAKVVDWPAYQMLASGRITKVVSISSSVVHEARYFGIETDFLFKPVFQFGKQFGKHYLSIYQEFVSPHFWSQALAPLLPTTQCERVIYLEQKDKLRDMLNFYWSYRHVDKTEDIRQTLLAIDRKVQSLLPKKAAPKAAEAPALKIEPVQQGRDWSLVLADVRALMQQHAVVSFDVFDTLIERPFEHPNDLFDYLAPKMRELAGLPELDFRKIRQDARSYVKNGRHGEEVTLAERYRAMAEHLGISPEAGERMRQLEKETELRLCRPRKTGHSLYELALILSKKIILVSDIYFEEDFMTRLLERHGYTRHAATYLSSKEGKLKHSGNLYPAIVKAMGVAPNAILHIGDNAHSDIKQAKAAGLTTYHLPKAVETLARRSRLAGHLGGGGPVLRSVIRGLVGNRLADNPFGLAAPSHAGSAPADFGYAVAGPMFFGFAAWLLQQSIADKVEVLYFLARDGEIVKRCYDVLAPYFSGAPRSVYLRASRRGVNVPALRTEDDVLAMLAVNFTPTSLRELIQNRFGLEIAPGAALVHAGYESLDDIASYQRDAEKLKTFFKAIAPQILANAREEREALIGYYASEGLLDGCRKAVVDIGHNGTLQASISSLMGDSRLGGYYFVTYKEIERLQSRGLHARGYLAERLDGKSRTHAYSTYILMFEALFLNTEGSFVRMHRRDGGWSPELLSTNLEAGRVEFIRQVHDASVELCADLAGVLGSQLGRLRLDGDRAVAAYLAMLRSPTLIDAQLFSGIGFENVYSGRNTRLVIDCIESDAEATISNSLWKEGATVLTQSFVETAPPERLRTRIVRNILKRLVSEEKYRKYLNSPKRFFSESKWPLVRNLAPLILR